MATVHFPSIPDRALDKCLTRLTTIAPPGWFGSEDGQLCIARLRKAAADRGCLREFDAGLDLARAVAL